MIHLISAYSLSEIIQYRAFDFFSLFPKITNITPNACYDQVTFHCTDEPHLISLLISRWAWPLFAAWPYDA